jgi:hypothetical protein
MLQVTGPCKCGKHCKPRGSAEGGRPVASLGCGDASLLALSVPLAAVSCGQELAINNRDGPVECPAAPGASA